MAASRVSNPLAWVRPEPLIAVILWAGIFAAVKLGLREIPFLSLTAARLAIAALVLLAISGRPTDLRLPRKHWRQAAIAGIPQVLFQVLLFVSLVFTTASTSALLFAASPILLTLGVWISQRQAPLPRRVIGLGLGILGVGLVVQPGASELSSSHVIGGLFALASAAAWAWYAVAVRPLVAELGSIRATAWSVTLAWLYITPFALPEMVSVEWQAVSWVGWAALLYNVLLGTVVAMTLWGRAVHYLGPVQTMAYTYLEPIAAVAIAAVLLGESITSFMAIGGVLIFLAVWLAR